MADDSNSKEVKRIGYGLKVPSLKFDEVIEIIKITNNKAGSSNSIDALSRITGNSSSSSTFNKKVSALKNFGVIDVDKSTYTITDLGMRIAEPESFEQQAGAMFEAFLRQENLKKIWEYFKGKRLPQDEFLSNAIIKILNIPPESKTDWSEYFISAGIYAGVLEQRENGYQVLSSYVAVPLNSPNEQITIKPEIISSRHEDENYLTSPVKKESMFDINEGQWGILSNKNVSSNRKAIFAIPQDLTQQDIDSIRILLKGIDVQLDGLKKNEE